jgi:TPR repeat protein
LLASQQQEQHLEGFNLLESLAKEGYTPAERICGQMLLSSEPLDDRLFFEKEQQGIRYLVHAAQKRDRKAFFLLSQIPTTDILHAIADMLQQHTDQQASPTLYHSLTSSEKTPIAPIPVIAPSAPQAAPQTANQVSASQSPMDPKTIDEPCQYRGAFYHAFNLTHNARTFEKGLRFLATLADAPNHCPHACYTLGSLLLVTQLCRKNPAPEFSQKNVARIQHGIELLKKTAHANDSPEYLKQSAYFNLGYCAEMGLGMPADPDTALEYYSSAGDLPAALYNKALLLNRGHCTKHVRTTQKVITLLKEAHQRGNPKALGYLACVCDQKGQRVEQERGFDETRTWYQQTRDYYNKAADHNDPAACANGGNLLHRLAQKSTDPQDSKLKKRCALHLWKKGAFLGDAEAFTNWGCLTSEQAEQIDDPVAKDYKLLLAIQLLSEGARRGDSRASFYLGLHALRIAHTYKKHAEQYPDQNPEKVARKIAENQQLALFFFKDALAHGDKRAEEYCKIAQLLL